MAAANWISMGGGKAQWASNMTAPSGPTALRAFSMDLTRGAMSFLPPEEGRGPPVPTWGPHGEGLQAGDADARAAVLRLGPRRLGPGLLPGHPGGHGPHRPKHLAPVQRRLPRLLAHGRPSALPPYNRCVNKKRPPAGMQEL